MIGIISDTHEQKKEIENAVKIFKDKNVDFVVHCGDIISRGVLKHFKGVNMRFVLGNNNCDQENYDKGCAEFGWDKITATKEFTHEGKKFFVCHGHDLNVLNNAIESQNYDYVLTGHTHKMRDERIGKTRVINPGTLFSDDNTIATIDIKTDKLEFIRVQ